MSKEQTNILRRVQKWIAQNLIKLTTVQIFVLVVVIAVFVSMILVVIIDTLWDRRISLELEFAGVIVPFLDGMLIVAILVAILNELRNKIYSSEIAIKNLEQSESDLRSLVENSPIAMIVDVGVDVDEKVATMNQKFTELFGYTIEDIPDVRHWWALAYPDETLREKVRIEWTEKASKAVQGSTKIEPMETMITCKDGSKRYVRVSLSSVGARNIVTFENLTERKNTEEMLIKSHDLLQSVIENAPIRVFWKDSKLNYLGCNTAFAKDAGKDRAEDIIGKDDYQMGWSAQAELYRDDDKRVMDSGISKIDYEEPQTTPDGGTIWLSTSKVPLRGADGKSIGLLGIYEDITERKSTELNIKRLSDLYATLSQCNKAIVYSNNKEELFTQICHAIVQSSGFKMAWIGLVNEEQQQIISVASYGDTDGYLEDIQISMDATDPRGRGPTGTAVRESEPFWCQDFLNDPRTLPWRETGARSGWKSSAALPLYQKGDTVGALTIYSGEVNAFDESARNLLTEMATDVSYALDAFTDKAERKEMITAMKSHEVSLAELNKFLLVEKKGVEDAKIKDEALLSSLGEGMLSVDTEGKILAMNRMAEKLLGWSESEVLGKIATDIILAVDEGGNPISAENRICSMVATGKVTETLIGPTYLLNKDGDKIPVIETATPVIIDGINTGAVVIFRDTTEEKEIEKTRGDLLALASHQLRTPLSGTKWLIETLQSGLKGELNKEQKEYLTEIYKINERMTTLVVDMLGVLRMEGGSIALNKSQVSTTALLDTILETFSPVAKSKQLAFRIEKDDDYTIETDPLLLRNIIESFISNALAYSNIGGEVVVKVKKEPAEIVFSVKDSGIGIPKNEQTQLFERFYRATNAKTFNTKGTGLGLYIAATLAKKIGVRLSLESEEGAGSTFYVHVPFSTPEVLPEYTTRV